MKTLILYNSKKGFTLKCAEYLHNEIKDSDLFSIDSKPSLCASPILVKMPILQSIIHRN